MNEETAVTMTGSGGTGRRSDALMNHKYARARGDVVVGLVVVAISVTAATWMHRTDSTYSCLKAPCAPLHIGYPVIDRLAVVAPGLLIAGIVVAVRRRQPWEDWPS